jgi:hypothetical protein
MKFIFFHNVKPPNKSIPFFYGMSSVGRLAYDLRTCLTQIR